MGMVRQKTSKCQPLQKTMMAMLLASVTPVDPKPQLQSSLRGVARGRWSSTRKAELPAATDQRTIILMPRAPKLPKTNWGNGGEPLELRTSERLRRYGRF
ncbi:hypothetical protein NDU88_004232 [Pleurodeles waltl]|uniref:Uncharacterized protein n=1 Tax=Pleurodeles waltl TaxID=8319 RepID=A0AAV7LKQ8_PLEWA|nr:hypothetical protein NDU88_004232 [Pleurodeles waltl]